MRLRLRKWMLFAVLAGTVAFLVFDKPENRASGGVASRDPAAPAAAPRADGDALQVPERRILGRSRGELFAAPPPPPPPPAQVVVAPTPVAPPVPYRFAGKVRRGAEEEILISKGDFVFAVKAGDTLDGTYRVDAVSADRIEIVYLPLGTKERIAVSSALDGERPQASSATAPRAAQAAPAAPAQTSAQGTSGQGTSAPPSDGRPAQLRWEGPERVQAGALFSVALRVNTDEPLRAAPMQLRFEPGVLEPMTVRPGKFFGQGNFTYRVNPDGSIFVGASSQTAAPGADAELLVVTFRPIKRGATAELSMSALSLQGAAGRTIAHEQVSAFRAAIQ